MTVASGKEPGLNVIGRMVQIYVVAVPRLPPASTASTWKVWLPVARLPKLTVVCAVGAHLSAENLSEDDVMQAMREHGIDDVQQVKTAVLEVDGTISIIQKDQAVVVKTQKRFRRQKHI